MNNEMPRLIETVKDGILDFSARCQRWLDTPNGRGVLKCTIAYTIASLATFVPFVANFLGKPEGKHVVATITVYFHPARSTGSMIEAILIAIVAVAYAEVISVLSMVTSVFFGSTMHLATLSHVLVVVVFIGGGFGFMGWVKQRMLNPLVNVGTTLASLAIIGVVTKENHVMSNVFSNEKVLQVFKMLVMGITTTTLVNVFLWRTSARASLRETMNRVSIPLGDMLYMITNSFLSGSEECLVSDGFTAASTHYSKSYAQMMKDMREAKFEHYFLGHEAIYEHEQSVARSMETLSQALGGLRNATNTQLEQLKHPKPLSPDADGISTPNTARELFEHFNESIAMTMSTVRQNLCRILHEPQFGQPPHYEINVDEDLRRNLMDSLDTFDEARSDALHGLYERIENMASSDFTTRANLEEVAAACGHFTFSLQSFGEDVLQYLDVLDDLQYVVIHKSRSWRWLIWWKNNEQDLNKAIRLFESAEADMLMRSRQRSVSGMSVAESSANVPTPVDVRTWYHAPDLNKILAWFWRNVSALFKKMARDDIQFGLKVGIGAALWAMLAFLKETRELYTEWRGEWGLLSFIIVCSFTVGASNTVSLARFIGTLFGALFSIVNWKISHGYALALIPLGWLTSFINFYLVIQHGKASFGRISLLAYNVSTLYAYRVKRRADGYDTDDSVFEQPDIIEIAKRRAIAVTAGIIWGLVICRVIWPISARRKFKESLSVLHLQMGLIWKRGPLTVLFRSEGSQSYLKSGEQAALQRYAANLDSLRMSAASEFELRGPFPMDVYGRVLKGTMRILDSFYNMSLVACRKGHLTEGEKALLSHTARERAILCDHICQAFQVVASSTMLEYPFADATGSIVSARENLLSKIFEFRKEHHGGLGSGDGVLVEERDYALLYAYALVTGQVADELRMVGKEIGSLFGVLDEDTRLLQ
ncbi:Fusaric acid resistance protein-like-domain-containing protein [Fusarium flagelliforme]|uniref:Fusaric acid resistance protein-like-domain-containing protein n=1 Tax=Fusarium flagelliforme TaxID=2675880 RepID=UPI001E8DBE9E|nr:Fusaric acid resistance protein-like-domain-containing protein [Fusarium flagelliforme]KAH7186064.1 Fusaric acid resistance protein-like-domain-containing protein [Fusarium flagelliforme]